MKLRDILTEEDIVKSISYSSDKIKVFVLPYSNRRSSYYASIKGEPAVAMVSKGSSVTGGFHTIGLESVYSDNTFQFFYKNEIGMFHSRYGFDSDFLLLDKTLDLDIEIKELPDTRIIRDVLIDDDNDVAFVISDRQYYFSQKTRKIHKITRTELKELEISKMMVARDGGTTHYYTSDGEIFIETPLKKDNRLIYFEDTYKNKTPLIIHHETYNYLGQKICSSLGIDWPEQKLEKIAEYNGK